MYRYSLNICSCRSKISFFFLLFNLFNEHLVFHKNWGQYNLYVKAILSNFRALRYVSDVDDYHKRFPTYHKIPSIFWVWKSADFQERESYDMLGISYENHPRLKRILMPESWIGWPLRKDYIAPNFFEIQDAY